MTANRDGNRPSLISAQGITRAFGSGDQRVVALQEVDLNVFPGEFLAVTGRSGSGKTTLLNLLAGLDQPTAGHVLFDGQDLSAIPDAALVELRRHKIGFVFQSFGLMPLLSAYENVELPLHIGGVSWRERRRRALEALELVGLGLRSRHRPYELSGVSSSGWPSHGRWSPIPRWSSPTSLLANWTATQRRPSPRYCARSRPNAASP